MNTVYYAGDSEQWYRIHDDAGVGYNGLYFYEKCVHFGDYSVWTYASNGMPTTEVCKESDSITLQPTCYKDGVRTHYCDCAGCDYTRTTYVSKLAHSFKDNVCSHCGDMRIAVDENSFAAYVENGTIAVDRFEFDGDFGGAVSTNKTHSSVSRLTINITEKTTLSFTYGSSSEYGADYITIYVNGISWGRLSGMNTSYFNSLLEAGDVVEICYSKDESVSSNDDMGYIKDIQLIVANKQSN